MRVAVQVFVWTRAAEAGRTGAARTNIVCACYAVWVVAEGRVKSTRTNTRKFCWIVRIHLHLHPNLTTTKMTDPNSQANVDAIITQHIHLDLAVDFTAHVLKGSAVFDVEALKDGKCFPFCFIA